jgi:hypothetical protein
MNFGAVRERGIEEGRTPIDLNLRSGMGACFLSSFVEPRERASRRDLPPPHHLRERREDVLLYTHTSSSSSSSRPSEMARRRRGGGTLDRRACETHEVRVGYTGPNGQIESSLCGSDGLLGVALGKNGKLRY